MVISAGAGLFQKKKKDTSAAVGGVATGKKFRRKPEGGMLRGKGSTTSDSLDGVMLDRAGKATPIAVSNDEAVLTARAVDLLGEDFIHKLNAGKLTAGSNREAASMGEKNMAAAKPSPVFVSAPPPASAPEVRLTTINAVDSPSMLESALNSPVGGKKMVNFIRANKGQIRAALG